MKLKLFSCFFLLCFASLAQSVVRTISVNGQSRSFRLYVPNSYNALNPAPLVFNFHGYTSNASEQELYGDFTEISDTAGFILVHPDGTDPGSGTFWNCFATTANSNFDYLFVEAILTTLNSELNIDPFRIYSTGMSNGGFMSYDMACFMTTKFAAIASVTGSMVSTHKSACNPNRKIPVMEIHGTSDQTVTYAGTGGIVSSTNIDTLVRFWVLKNQCDLVPLETALTDISSSDNCSVIHYVYSGTDLNSAVELYKVIGGGHTWPGAIFPSAGQNTNQDFSASKEIWRFFTQHSLDASELGITENEVNAFELSLFPNPSADEVAVKLNQIFTGEIELFDVYGNLVLRKGIQNQSEISLDIQEIKAGVYFLRIGNQKVKLFKM